jgi:hypothetical protein
LALSKKISEKKCNFPTVCAAAAAGGAAAVAAEGEEKAAASVAASVDHAGDVVWARRNLAHYTQTLKTVNEAAKIAWILHKIITLRL